MVGRVISGKKPRIPQMAYADRTACHMAAKLSVRVVASAYAPQSLLEL
jgi:hypothetical protein